MKLRLPHRWGKWVVYIDSIEGVEEAIRVPSTGYYNSKKAAVAGLLSMFHVLAGQGQSEYLSNAQTESKKYGLSVTDYLGLVVEHQICLRNPDRNSLCLSGGIGDTIHSLAEKVDAVVNKAPKFVQKAVSAITKVTLHKGKSVVPVNKISGCSSCGGRKSYSPTKNNLGRAGTLNRITNKK